MRKNREDVEREEARHLFAYAQHSASSRGRVHAEPRHPYRTEYQRDRARVIHSRAFRRLEYKTQVFLNGTGDHFRTRLTHSIEVASISRTIARALGLNEDLAEAIALAHDLGHPPFGHPGESTLNRLMSGHGGFDHNEQSLRIVELIESGYPNFPGLNLSFETLEGLQKHHRFFEIPSSATHERFPCPSLEAQVANLADEITYNSHDLDDGLDSGLLSVKQLRGLTLWREADESADGDRRPGKARPPDVIRQLIDLQVEDLLATSAARIQAANLRDPDDARRQPMPLIAYSAALEISSRELRKFLYANLYAHPEVAQANDNACRRLEEVFAAYLAAPQELGEAAFARIETQGLERTVCDYLSGMTDRYLAEEHFRLFPTK